MEGGDQSPKSPSCTRSFHFAGTPPPSPLALYSSSSSSSPAFAPPSPPPSATKPPHPTPTGEPTSASVEDEQSSSTAASSSSGKSEQQGPSMVNQFFKLLLRKHSSGDLHSRLKTRKLLGVGETDDGDIHRSKLSQILGHSDQLYIRLPYGLRVWQLLLAVMFSVVGAWAIVLPSHLFQSALEFGDGDHVTLPVRLYGGALVSLSLVFWITLSSQDRDTIRMCLLASIVYFTIQIVVSAMSSVTLSSPVSICLGETCHVIWRATQMLGSLYFYVVLTREMTLGHLLVYSRPAEQRHSLILLLCSRAAFALISAFYHWALTQRKFCPGAGGSGLRKNLSSGKDLGAAGGGSSAIGGGIGCGGGRAVPAGALYNGSSSSSYTSSGGGGSGSGSARDDSAGAASATAAVSLGEQVKSKDV